MVYLLRALIDWLIPLGMIFIVGAVGIVWGLRRAQMWPMLAAFVLVWAASTDWVGGRLVHGLEYAYRRPARLRADAIVVLGEGAVPATPQAGGLGTVSGDMANELLTAARLARLHRWPVLISGGAGGYGAGNEALIGRRILSGLGVRRVAVDPTSETTVENAVHSAAILRARGWRRPVLVTSGYHMIQAVEDFRAAGVRVIPYPTDYLTPAHFGWPGAGWVASLHGLDLTSLALNEYVSIIGFHLGVLR